MKTNRIIIISGMPRSGTSILTYILSLHPDVTLFVEGSQGHVLENHLLYEWQSDDYDIKKLTRILDEVDTKYILLKRPHVYNNQSIKDFFVESKFIITAREFESINNSWQNTNMVEESIKQNSKEFFDTQRQAISDFLDQRENTSLHVQIEQLWSRPEHVIKDISRFLDINNETFKRDTLQYHGRWDDHFYLRDVLLKGKAITDLSEEEHPTTRPHLQRFLSEEEIGMLRTI